MRKNKKYASEYYSKNREKILKYQREYLRKREKKNKSVSELQLMIEVNSRLHSELRKSNMAFEALFNFVREHYGSAGAFRELIGELYGKADELKMSVSREIRK